MKVIKDNDNRFFTVCNIILKTVDSGVNFKTGLHLNSRLKNYNRKEIEFAIENLVIHNLLYLEKDSYYTTGKYSLQDIKDALRAIPTRKCEDCQKDKTKIKSGKNHIDDNGNRWERNVCPDCVAYDLDVNPITHRKCKMCKGVLTVSRYYNCHDCIPELPLDLGELIYNDGTCVADLEKEFSKVLIGNVTGTIFGRYVFGEGN
jgi:hypothetical protein